MYRLGDKLISIGGRGFKEFPIRVSGVALTQSTISFTKINDTFQLTYTVSPSNAVDKSVTFSSSNTNVATVNSTGLVTSIGNGDAVITITTTDGGFTDTCNVNVSVVIYTIASGGIETYDGDYKIHSFKTVGTSTFTVHQVGTDDSFEYLIVAGGGGGGATADWETYGGGGGAGGMLEGTMNLNTQAYSIVVGAGGTTNNNGSNSTALGLTATGGGKGGLGDGNTMDARGGNGGCGGGAGCQYNSTLYNYEGGNGTTGQGNNGGSTYSTIRNSANGGGKSTAGDIYTSANNGLGKSNSITGSAITYCTGGSGTNHMVASGNGANAAANTGNGGAGATSNISTLYSGGRGGSGIVIIRYKYK